MLQWIVKLTAIVTSHCWQFSDCILHVAEDYDADSSPHAVRNFWFPNIGRMGILHVAKECQANSSCHITLSAFCS